MSFDHFTGTRDVPSQHAIDLEALNRYLTMGIGFFSSEKFEEIQSVGMFKGGQSNPTYKLQGATKSYVMRAKPGPVAKLLPSAHAVEREFKIMHALAGSDVPVARMHVLCEDESVLGRAFYIMDFVDGTVLWDQALPDQTPTERGAIYAEMNRVISALHTVDFKARGLEAFGKPGNYFDRQIGRWSKQYVASITQPIDEMDKLMAWLPANIPALARQEGLTSIVHGDFRLDNLMFDKAQATVRAVLDWELSTLGHPLADFSYHCMAWHIPPGTFRGIGGLEHAALGIPSEAAYIESYCQSTHLFKADQLAGEWNFYLAYNLFRLAAILQGIAKRVEAGTASSAQAVSSAAGARPLAEMAWRFAQLAKAAH
jgi:aminoglycoside phosphotransferase (APT) family kinase protein